MNRSSPVARFPSALLTDGIAKIPLTPLTPLTPLVRVGQRLRHEEWGACVSGGGVLALEKGESKTGKPLSGFCFTSTPMCADLRIHLDNNNDLKR